jgi:hypothetical protein
MSGVVVPSSILSITRPDAADNAREAVVGLVVHVPRMELDDLRARRRVVVPPRATPVAEPLRLIAVLFV